MILDYEPLAPLLPYALSHNGCATVVIILGVSIRFLIHRIEQGP